jgi:hypothetical protein
MMATIIDTDSNSDLDADLSYIYKPLDSTQDEIRVLEIQAGDGDGIISTKLRPISLLSVQDYETISYVWGDPSKRVSIIIDGEILSVPASAERAIRRMRTDIDRVLWIDAVCINQEDLIERKQQVSLMGDVYQKTKRNTVWLGPSQESTASAIQVIHTMWDDLLRATKNLETWYEFSSHGEFSRYRRSMNIALMMSLP